MNHWMSVAAMIAKPASSHFLQRLVFVAVALALCAATLGCNQTPGETPAGDYGATVEALLPTAGSHGPANADTHSHFRPTHRHSASNVHSATPAHLHALAHADQGNDREPAARDTFNAPTLDGSEFSLQDGFGSPTLLAFFAPW